MEWFSNISVKWGFHINLLKLIRQILHSEELDSLINSPKTSVHNSLLLRNFNVPDLNPSRFILCFPSESKLKWWYSLANEIRAISFFIISITPFSYPNILFWIILEWKMSLNIRSIIHQTDWNSSKNEGFFKVPTIILLMESEKGVT